jgi:hypothetical protein
MPDPENIHDAVARYFSERDWPYEDHGDFFVTPVTGNHGAWTGYFAIAEEDQQLIVYSLLPHDVPDERRTAVALYLTRANYGLGIGGFELDLDSGTVRYKTSIDVEGRALDQPLIDHLFLANIVSTDRYVEGLEAVIAGGDPANCAAVAERG